MNFDWQPNLEDDLLVLRPLRVEDFEPLFHVASDPQIWAQHPAHDRWQRPVFESLFREAMGWGSALVAVEKSSGEVVGSSRYAPVLGFEPEAVEIGWSFLARRCWGGEFNFSMKKLMIQHAFRFVENVVFYVNDKNFRSQKAMEKIGGQRVASLNGRSLPTKLISPVIFLISKNSEKWKTQTTI